MTDGETASTLQPFNASTIPQRHRALSLSRIFAITSNTLTEPTRLKVFYVLLVFGLLLIGSSVFMAQFSFQQEFHVTALQPRVLMFWDTAAWHMAWNASVAAMNDTSQPRQALRVKAQREYFALGKDFLERGIKNNPDRPELYEALARLYKEKYKDHERAAEYYAKAAKLPDAAPWDRRFSAYELSYCEGREHEAYERLRGLYDEGEKERLPTLVRRLKFLEDKLAIPQDQRIPDTLSKH
jgi:hypothetical protein